MGIIISAETTCDLPNELLEKYKIAICGQNYFMGENTYNVLDNSYDSHSFYESMRKGGVPTTSQVNPSQAKSHLLNLLKQNDKVLHVSFSSGLSGSYNSFFQTAKELKNDYPNRIYVVDSLCCSGGEGLYLMLLAQKIDEGASFEKLISYAENLKLKIVHLFTVGGLKYLQRSGRVSKASAYLASILNIKILLHVDDDGHLVPIQKVIGRKAVIKKMVDRMLNERDTAFGQIVISHADCLNDALYLQQLVSESTGIKATIVDVDFVIGSHCGPDTLSLFYVSKNR